jgi:hypothetical protein
VGRIASAFVVVLRSMLRRIDHESTSREPGRRRASATALVVLLVLVAAVLGAAVLLAQASASQSGADPVADCPHGAISAIGPVDVAGRGDTVPDVACIDP